jgi:hypothetical protein
LDLGRSIDLGLTKAERTGGCLDWHGCEKRPCITEAVECNATGITSGDVAFKFGCACTSDLAVEVRRKLLNVGLMLAK